MGELHEDHHHDDIGPHDTHVSDPDIQLTLTGPAWALRWAAPEVVYGEFQDLASDVWAAAWVCWEVCRSDKMFAVAALRT